MEYLVDRCKMGHQDAKHPALQEAVPWSQTEAPRSGLHLDFHLNELPVERRSLFSFKRPWKTCNSLNSRLSRISVKHSAVQLSQAWSLLTFTQIEAQMEWKVNNFQWGTDRQENGEMQEGDDLNGGVYSQVMCCLSLLYHLTELFNCALAILVIWCVDTLIGWLIGFECELLVMRWSTSLVTTTDPSWCSSLVFLVRHLSNAQLRVP